MFKEPYEAAVREAVQNAFSIAYEGCHKIYIQLDRASHNEMVEFGYEPILVTEDKDAAVNQLWEWFDNSCCLRFINATKRRVTHTCLMYETEFIDVIPQGAYDDDEDDEDYGDTD